MSLARSGSRFFILIKALFLVGAFAAPFTLNSNPDAEALGDYFTKYTTDYFATAVQPSAVSSEGVLLDLSLEDNPIFRDHVLTFQKMANLEPTGTITNETLLKMDESRCGVPDSIFDPSAPGKYEVQSTWLTKKHSDTGFYVVSYTFPKKTTPDGVKFRNFKKGVTLAMCSWELVSNFRFKNIGLGKKSADVAISYEEGNHGDGYSFDGRGGTLAHAFYPEDGRLHLDVKERWYLATPGKPDHSMKDIYTVVIHELGHTLGLLHSKVHSAIMAPFYRFQGTFEELKMPEDEIKGITQMYGKRIDSNPVEEKFSACREAKIKYGYKIAVPARTKNTKTTAVLEEFEDVSCADDPVHGPTHCPAWKARGFCTQEIFARTLHKRCPRTCGFCTAAVPADKKPEKVLTPSGLATTICEISQFDSMLTTFDERSGFAATFFKGNYYFQTEIDLSAAKYDTHSLFNKTEDLKGAYRWGTDPKTILPGLFKIKSPNFLVKTEQSHASLIVGKRYFIFEGESVHIYRRDMGVIGHQTKHEVAVLFPGYPNNIVDAAHAITDDKEDSVTFTLFRGSKMWQYKEFRDRGHDNQLFAPVPNKTGVDISEWNGVPACNIDAVFEYRGVPYFLKGNIFWPAVDTEPQIPRDITYNFFRCWEKEPEDLSIPSSCDATTAPASDNDVSTTTDPGNGADSSQSGSATLLTVLTLLSHLMFKHML